MSGGHDGDARGSSHFAVSSPCHDPLDIGMSVKVASRIPKPVLTGGHAARMAISGTGEPLAEYLLDIMYLTLQAASGALPVVQRDVGQNARSQFEHATMAVEDHVKHVVGQPSITVSMGVERRQQ
jgi:hypothetical protein